MTPSGMLPFHHHNVRVMIVSGTRTRNPEASELPAIRTLLDELVRLDGHLRDGRRYLPGIGHVRWRQAPLERRPAPPAPSEETGRYLVMNVDAGPTLEDLLWKETFSDPEAAHAAFAEVVADNERFIGAPGEVYLVDRMDGRVLQAVPAGRSSSARVARWLRFAEDELRDGRSSIS